MLRDRQALAHRELAQADVVRRRAGRVLEEVAERRRRADGQLQAHAGVRRDRGARVAARQLALHGGVGRERVLEVPRALAGRHEVDVVHALAPTPQAPGDLDHRAGDGLAEVARRSPRPRAAPGRSARAPRHRPRRPRSGRAPPPGAPRSPRRSRGPAHAPVGERGRQVVDARHPELAPQRGGALGADALQPGDVGEADGHPLAELGERGDVARLDQLDDLRLERGADVGQVDGAPAHRHLGDRRRRSSGSARRRGDRPGRGAARRPPARGGRRSAGGGPRPRGWWAAPWPSAESRSPRVRGGARSAEGNGPPPVNLEGATGWTRGRLRRRWYRLPRS